MNEERLRKRYERERKARQAAESILEKKSLELYQRNKELEHLKDNLEKQVFERTHEAEKAKTEAREANLAKSQFLANMSHAIRTPLTAIIGFAEVLLQHNSSREESAKFLTTIIGSGRHLTTLIGEILDVSKIENEKLELNPLRFNLPDLLQNIEQIYTFNCQREQLEFALIIDSVIPEWIVADSTRIKQVIDNLLSNAIKFTQTGSISLNVKFTSSSSTLHINVIDSGQGIDKDKQALIFDYFSQGDASITQNFGGTGLGLFITKSLVELMGGGVELQSTMGVGSKFSMSIVCQEYEGECKSLESRDIIVPPSVTIPSFVGNVLLVEDTEINQQLITLNLQQTGAEVDLAINGLDGLQKALTGEYDLVLMDIQMPVMDGKEAMKSLKQLGVNMPVYALTANVMPSDIQEYADIGFTGTLCKPLELENLYYVLGQHLAVHGEQVDNKVQETKLIAQNPKIKALFYAELVKQHAELTENIHNLDYAGLIRITHVIKGSAGSFGHDNLTSLATYALLLLRQKQYVEGLQHCINLNLKVAEVLNEYND